MHDFINKHINAYSSFSWKQVTMENTCQFVIVLVEVWADLTVTTNLLS